MGEHYIPNKEAKKPKMQNSSFSVIYLTMLKTEKNYSMMSEVRMTLTLIVKCNG